MLLFYQGNFVFQDDARQNINDMLGKIEFQYGECAVRVNSVDSGLAEEDLNLTLTGDILPDAILLPKVENDDHIRWVSFV